jgi:hypothetical protein
MMVSLVCRDDITSLLRRIRHAQHLLDPFDIEGVIHVWNRLLSSSISSDDTATAAMALIARADRMLRDNNDDAIAWRQMLGQQLMATVQYIERVAKHDPNTSSSSNASPVSMSSIEHKFANSVSTIATPTSGVDGGVQKEKMPTYNIHHWQQCARLVLENHTPTCNNATIVKLASSLPSPSTSVASSSSSTIIGGGGVSKGDDSKASITTNGSMTSTISSIDDDILRHFAVAATLKDLSIMIPFVPHHLTPSSPTSPASSSSTASSAAYGSLSYECWIADLDVKPMSKIPVYWQQDCDIIAGYQNKFHHVF